MFAHVGVAWLIVQTAIPAVAGLLDIALGGWMTGHHQKKDREGFLPP
jgi:hypothetical protein